MNTRAFGVGVGPAQIAGHPILNQRQTLVLAAGAYDKLDSGKRLVTSLLVQVATGVLDVWLGDRVGTNDGAPDFRFQAGLGPQQVFLPPNDYEFTFYNPLTLQSTQAAVRLLGG